VDGADEVRNSGVDVAAVCGSDVRHDGIVRVDSRSVEAPVVRKGVAHH